MADARLAVLLISADFLSSEFITGVEVPELLRRREREGMRVFPILAQSCVWKQIEWLPPIQRGSEGPPRNTQVRAIPARHGRRIQVGTRTDRPQTMAQTVESVREKIETAA